MLIEVEGIVTKEVMYQESSKILTIFTKEFGIIGVVSKGCRGVKSKLRAGSRVLTFGKFFLRYKEGGLSVLTSIDIINPFTSIFSDISKISYASYMLELSSEVFKSSNEIEIFDILKNALIKVNDGYDEEVLMHILEVKYLTYLGVGLHIDSCTVCGNKTNIKTVSIDNGGFVCDKCYRGEKIYSSKTIQLLRAFSYVEISKISKLEVSSDTKLELDIFLEEYLEKYSGLSLKARTLLKNLKKIGG